MHLVRDVLDKLMVDANHDPLGRVDGIVLIVEEGKPPRVVQIEAGATVIAERLNRRLGRWARGIARRWGLVRGRPTRIAWEKILSVGIEVKVDVKADAVPTTVWEHWLREHFVERLPGGKA
jgi:hypothetical protein